MASETIVIIYRNNETYHFCHWFRVGTFTWPRLSQQRPSLFTSFSLSYNSLKINYFRQSLYQNAYFTLRVQMQTFLWPVFSCIQTENTDQKNLRIWTLFTRCYSQILKWNPSHYLIKSIFSIFLNYKINLHEFKYRKKQNIFIIFAVLQTSTVGFTLPLTFTISPKFWF